MYLNRRVFVLQDCYLVSILNELAGNSFIIFCSTCNNAQRVALLLRNLGITAIPLHGQMSQVEPLTHTSQAVSQPNTFPAPVRWFCSEL